MTQPEMSSIGLPLLNPNSIRLGHRTPEVCKESGDWGVAEAGTGDLKSYGTVLGAAI